MTALFWILLVLVLVALFGGAVFAAGWWLLWTILVGLVIGGLARLLVRGTAGLGFAPTAVAGIAGALLGGWIGHWIDVNGFVQLVIEVLVAAVFIAIGTAGSRSSSASD